MVMNEKEIASRWMYKENWNFAQIPPAGDFVAYGKALLSCASGDGKISQAERDWVIGYGAAYGAPSSVLELLHSYTGGEDVVAVLDAAPAVKMSKRNIILDAIRACAADGELHPGEMKAIRKMAHVVGVDDWATEQLLHLYLEEQALKAKRIALIFPDGKPY